MQTGLEDLSERGEAFFAGGNPGFSGDAVQSAPRTAMNFDFPSDTGVE